MIQINAHTLHSDYTSSRIENAIIYFMSILCSPVSCRARKSRWRMLDTNELKTAAVRCMQAFLTEDEITEIFADHLIEQGFEILSRAKGRMRGADIVANLKGKKMCIEAKGGGSQSVASSRFGQPFTRLQCQSHTDVAFACIPRMIARYKPDFVGIVLPDDRFHSESLAELVPAIMTLRAGAWLVSPSKVETVVAPKLLGQVD